jgi:hypothetical protein
MRLMADAVRLGPPAEFESQLRQGWNRMVRNDRVADKPDLCGCSMIRFIGEKRWIVERTFTGITTNRRLATDFEPFAAIVQALIQFAILGKTSPSWSDSVSARGGSFSRRGR